MADKCHCATSLPVSRGSAVDSELALLMRQFPRETTEFLDELYHSDHGRYKNQQKQGKQLTVAARTAQQHQTKYQEDFPPKPIRPRSNKRPPPTPRDPNPPPMTFDTWQRSVFVPKDIAAARTLPFKPDDNREAHHQVDQSGAKHGLTTSYRACYTPKELEAPGPAVHAAKADRSRHKLGATFYDSTTTGEHYQKWQPQPKIQFGELPTFTQSILYPDAQRGLQTEMMESFKGARGRAADLIKAGEPNIRLEGAHDFLTTHNETYVKREGQPLTRPLRVKPQLLVDKRQPLAAITQARADFPGFQDGQPRPPPPVEPLQPTIDLKFDQKRYFDTEQRAIYKGHDILQHPVPSAFMPADRKYVPPNEKFATTTVTRSDFAPLSIDGAAQVKAKMPRTRRTLGGKFYDQTTSKEFFQDWSPNVRPRVRYGDFHEAYKAHVPAVYKLHGVSETRDSFVPKQGEMVTSFKPEEVPIDQTGDRIFDTEYRCTYRGKKYALNRSQAAALKTRLRQMRQANTSKAPPMACAICSA